MSHVSRVTNEFSGRTEIKLCLRLKFFSPGTSDSLISIQTSQNCCSLWEHKLCPSPSPKVLAEGMSPPGAVMRELSGAPAKDCKAFGVGANKQKAFGKAPWHFFSFLFPLCTRCFTAFVSPYRCWFLACGVLETAGCCWSLGSAAGL